MNTSNNTSNVCDKDEISLKDIIDFFSISWIPILSFGFVGLMIALIFILTVPPQYKGIAQIQTSQLPPRGNANINGPNVEDPALLVQRFKLPSTYSLDDVKACILQDEDFLWGYEDPKEKLAKSVVKIYQPKGLNIIEIEVNRKTIALVQSCINAIVDRVRVTQNEIKEPFIQEARQKITTYQKQLEIYRNMIVRADNSGFAMTANYLSARDDVKFLRETIMELEDFVISAEARQAKLVSPIHVTNEPVFPKKTLTIVTGLIVGLFLGILFAASRRFLKYRIA